MQKDSLVTSARKTRTVVGNYVVQEDIFFVATVVKNSPLAKRLFISPTLRIGKQQMTREAVLFGGAGFIGSHFAVFLIQNKTVDKVVVADLMPLNFKRFSNQMSNLADQGLVEFIECDVRKPIEISHRFRAPQLIANFAAIHREPGHEDWEYYQTNLLGAENVCNWAENVDCRNLLFTSSIAPYGPTEDPVDESSLPVPATAYGGSKLVAEKIHIIWQKKDQANRTLVIVRPGVVFGQGEGGNVSRLIKALLKHYFFYMGNRETRKAGVYVKELCNAMIWAWERSKDESRGLRLFNMTMNPGPSVSEYVTAICETAQVTRAIPTIPFFLLYPVSVFIEALARVLRIGQPVSPVRLKKLVRSSNIVPQHLIDQEYTYRYTLKSALEDWRNECPEEW